MRPTSKSASESVTALDKRLAVTAGEPAGIGPDLCLALAGTPYANRLVVIADKDLLRLRAERLGIELSIVDYDAGRVDTSTTGLTVLSQPLADPEVCGEPSAANARSLLAGLDRAVDGCQAGEFKGVVTAPLQKSIINDAGIPFSGHTEYLAERTGTPTPVMLLAAGSLRVALATTHLPLRDVADHLTRERLESVLNVLHHDLVGRFSIMDPEIIVCGLNPHAGEGGHLGSEDADIIEPVVDKLRRRGMKVRGPIPADTAFTPHAGHADTILAMYHDQGLPVLKFAGFGNAVNVTLGLPIIRTSVDHGTALDLAGTGKADSGSMRAAVELALSMGGG